MEESALAAVYDGKRRWLVYQKSDRLIAVRNVRKGTGRPLHQFRLSVTKILPEDIVGSHRDQVKIKSQLAAVYAPGHKGSPGRIYIYFVNTDNSLYRAWSEVGDRLSFDGEGAPIEVDQNSGSIVDFSQISVVADPVRQRNAIYAVKVSNSSNSVVSTILDPWDRAYEPPPRWSQPTVPSGPTVGIPTRPGVPTAPGVGVPTIPGLPTLPGIPHDGKEFGDPQLMKEFFLLYAAQYMSNMEDKKRVT